MCSLCEIRNWGLRCELTTCHIWLVKKMDMTKHTLEVANHTDILVLSGKKWEEWYITL